MPSLLRVLNSSVNQGTRVLPNGNNSPALEDTTITLFSLFLRLKSASFPGLICRSSWKRAVVFPSLLLLASFTIEISFSLSTKYLSNFHSLSFDFHVRALELISACFGHTWRHKRTQASWKKIVRTMLWGHIVSETIPWSLVTCSSQSYILCRFHLCKSSKCRHVTSWSLASVEVLLPSQVPQCSRGSWSDAPWIKEHVKRRESGERMEGKFLKGDRVYQRVKMVWWQLRGWNLCRGWNATNHQTKRSSGLSDTMNKRTTLYSGSHFWLHFCKDFLKVVESAKSRMQGFSGARRQSGSWSNHPT